MHLFHISSATVFAAIAATVASSFFFWVLQDAGSERRKSYAAFEADRTWLTKRYGVDLIAYRDYGQSAEVAVSGTGAQICDVIWSISSGVRRPPLISRAFGHELPVVSSVGGPR